MLIGIVVLILQKNCSTGQTIIIQTQMQEDPKQKQDQFIPLQNTLQNLCSPQKLHINLFLPLSDGLSQKIQPPQIQIGIPNIQQETIKTSRLNQNSQDQKIKKNQKNKRKYSQKSQHYHRVHNSRKIKTKKVNKDYLQRSQYFYFDTVNQGGDDSKIMSLLNQYEAFHQEIFDSCFQKKVIKLSHYGNKANTKKNSNPQVLHLKNLTINDNFERSRSFKEGYLNLNKTLSKSLVEKHSSKIFSKSEVIENKKSQINFQAKNENKRSDFYYKVNKDINKKLVPQNNLSKHTTPIRTIFLNQTEQNVTHQDITNQTSPNHNVSSFTPLISQRVHKKPSLKPFKSILQNPIFNYSHKKYEMKIQNDELLNAKNTEKRSHVNNKLGISIVTRKDYYERTQSNIQVSDILRNGLSRNNHTLDEMILAQQITLPCNPYRHKSNNNLSDLQKFNFTLTSKQSESHSRSKKGLSLTQSATSIKTKNQLSKIYSKSITKIVHKKQQKKDNLLDKKLNFTYTNIPKRVQIRIY